MSRHVRLPMASLPEARGPSNAAGEVEADPDRPVCGQVQHQPQGRTSGPLPSFIQEGTSPLEFITLKEGVSNEKLHHALHTTTLLMSTLLLINSGKCHSYFTPLSSPLAGSNLRQPGGTEAGSLPPRFWRSCRDPGSSRSRGSVMEEPTKAWFCCPLSCARRRVHGLDFFGKFKLGPADF